MIWAVAGGGKAILGCISRAGLLLGIGGSIVIGLAIQFAGPMQLLPLTVIDATPRIRFRKAAFAELYLRNEFKTRPITPLPTPPPPARSSGRSRLGPG